MIYIDKDRCIGCGTCSAVCEKVFKLNEEELKAEVIKQDAKEPCVEEAITMCPVQAISKK